MRTVAFMSCERSPGTTLLSLLKSLTAFSRVSSFFPFPLVLLLLMIIDLSSYGRMHGSKSGDSGNAVETRPFNLRPVETRSPWPRWFWWSDLLAGLKTYRARAGFDDSREA